MFHLRSGSTSKAGSTQPTLFDVRLKTPYKNIVIIKGSEYEAPSIYVSGNLVFALPEKIQVKKIGLKLIGTFKLDFMEVLTHHNRISASNPIKETRVILECEWDNLLVNSDGVLKVGGYGGNNNSQSGSNSSSTSGTTTPIYGTGVSAASSAGAKPRLKRSGTPSLLQLPEPSIHTTPFENVSTPAGGNTFVLPAGNYELPFKCVLPGSIPETIEGLQSGSIYYKFEASLDKSSSLLKSSHFVKHKYFRIFRTLAPGNVALTEDVSIDNTWPGRVQYEVSIPRKAIAIGAVSPVKMAIIPLKKKLKLGKISASIIQHYVLKDSQEELYDHDQIIYECELPRIPMESLSQDRWDIHASIQIPSDLKVVTQGCELKDGMLKVKHKLRFKIQLINEDDGHVSELRAKLPVHLYVSPHYKILARNIELDSSGRVHIKPGGITIFEHGRTPGTPGTATPGASSGTNTPTVVSRPQSPTLDPITGDGELEEDVEEEDNAPPLYAEHIYDQLYDALTGATSPPTSPRPIIPRAAALSPGAATPAGEPGSYFDIPTGSATPTHDLLNQYLSHQGSVRGRAGIGNPNLAEDEFITNINSGSATPALDKAMSSLDLSTLSRVPSYNEAVQGSDDSDADLAPAYTDSDKSTEDVLLSPPRSAVTKSHSSGHVSTVQHSSSPQEATQGNQQRTGTQSYFDTTRNNSSNDLFQLGLTRPASVNNFSDLLSRRLAKKASHGQQSGLKNDNNR